MSTAFHNTVIRLTRSYAWAIIPLLVVASLQLNNNLYYDVRDSYDMWQHFENTYSIMHTGRMPPPPLLTRNYEAHQAPLYYILTAWILLLTDPFIKDGLLHVMPVVFFTISLVWTAVMIALVWRVLRRAPGWMRAVTVCVVMLFPMHIKVRAMFGNDLPVFIFGTLAAFSLWFMLRAAYHLNPYRWLSGAALSGFTIAFKNNGVILMGAYGLLAAYTTLDYALRRHYRTAGRIIIITALGLVLMLIPWLINLHHTLHYVEDPIGMNNPPLPMSQVVDYTFFTTFDFTVFINPYAFGPGERSYWSLQYVTLHSDYYNHWNSPVYLQLPPESLVRTARRTPYPYTHLHTAILVQLLAVPITLIMVFCFGYSLYRLLRKRRWALRDGSVLVVALVLVAQAAQFQRFAKYAYIQAAVIHARYLGFVHIMLFILGVRWIWRLTCQADQGGKTLVWTLMGISMAAYSAAVYLLMWLPPHSF